MKPMTLLAGFVCAVLVTSCAASIPLTDELIDARQAYARLSVSSAAQLVPGELQKARNALANAEKAFQNDPQSNRTRDLANFARLEAIRAEELARTASDNAFTAEAVKLVRTPKARP